MKFKLTYTFKSDFKKIEIQLKRAKIKTLFRVGAILRGTARRMIAPSKKRKKAKSLSSFGSKFIPALPGKPYRRGTGFLRDSIIFDVDRGEGSVELGYYRGWETAQLHELGERRRNSIYQKRPVVMVSIDKASPTIQKLFPEEYKKLF